MGRHFWTKRVDDEHDHKQPGCMSGLVHALARHHRPYNVQKMIHHSKHGDQNGIKREWSPEKSLSPNDVCEVEKLLEGNENPSHAIKRSRGINRKSIRSRIRELIAEEMHKEGDNAKGSKSRLQRTYSIHHLETLDDTIGKICTEWKQPFIFIPSKVDIYNLGSMDTDQIKAVDQNESIRREIDACQAAISESIEEPDFLDILKVDKELFKKKLQNSEESVARYSCGGALGLNRKEALSKSRSFPVHDLSQRLKFKPIKLEDKQKEIWSFPKRDKSHAVNEELKLTPSDDLGMSSAGDRKDEILDQYMMMKPEKQRKSELLTASDIITGIAEKREETTIERNGEYTTIRKYYHFRSASLNESLDRYARLFEHSNRTNNKLHLSKSLKITNETGHVPMYFKRMRSLSNVDSYYSHFNFGLAGDETFGDCSNVNGSLALGIVAEEEESKVASSLANDEEENKVALLVSDVDAVPQDLIEMSEMKTESVESFDCMQRMEDDHNIDFNIVGDNIIKIGEGLEEEAEQLSSSNSLCVPDNNCVNHCSSKDSNFLLHETLSHTEQLRTFEDKFISSFRRVGSRDKNDLDLHYMRYILDQSGIAENATDRAWYSSNQPLSPQLLEEAEAFWPHEEDQFPTGLDICSCWHHQMLFDLINEVLIQVYDHSLPYYPKALSSGCHVRPFPVGDNINEEVCTRISKLLDFKLEERQSLDCIMALELGSDDRWMNLQFESECVALELEDMIFHELLEEVM